MVRQRVNAVSGDSRRKHIATSWLVAQKVDNSHLVTYEKESLCHARKLTPVIEFDHAAKGTIFRALRFGGRIAQNLAASASGVPLW